MKLFRNFASIEFRLNKFLTFLETATFYDNHVFTFDGGYLYLPRVRGNGRCMYLLARDFRGGAFTILYKRDQLLMFIGQTTISFSRVGKVIVVRDIYYTLGQEKIKYRKFSVVLPIGRKQGLFVG